MLIFLIVISTAYSMYSKQLKMIGNINIVNQNQGTNPNIEPSKSTVRWNVLNQWPNGGEEIGALIKIITTNLDEDIDHWTISFDVPRELKEEELNIWSSSEVTVTEHGDFKTIILKNQHWNGNISKGQDIEISFLITFSKNVDIQISNLIINDKLVSNIERDRSITQ